MTVDNETYCGDVDSVIKMAPLTSGNKNTTVTFWNDSNYNDATFNVPFKVRNVAEAAEITTIKADNLTRCYMVILLVWGKLLISMQTLSIIGC